MESRQGNTKGGCGSTPGSWWESGLCPREFPGSPVVGTLCSLPRAQVQPPGGGTKIPETVRCNQKETTLFPSPTHINLPTIPWKEGLESNKQGARRGRELGEQGKGLPRDALTPTVLWRTRKLPGGRMCKSTVNKEPL